MKVLCINDKELTRVKFGEVYPVLGEKDDCYILFEDEGFYDCYDKNRFIPLSDIDETELATISEQDKIYH